MRTCTGTRRSRGSPRCSPGSPRRRRARLSADAVAIALAEVLEDVLGATRCRSTSNFFDDLGADSMVMARFCARLRKRDDLPDRRRSRTCTLNPTVGEAGFRARAARGPAGRPGGRLGRAAGAAGDHHGHRAGDPRCPCRRHRHVPVRRQRRILCGTLQLLFLLAYPGLAGARRPRRMSAGWPTQSAWSTCTCARLWPGARLLRRSCAGCRSCSSGCSSDAGARGDPGLDHGLPALLDRADAHPAQPLAMFVGSPLYSFYLRALGAKVGRGVSIFSRNVPVCTDLLRIGDGTVIRKDSFFTGYRAQNGVIQIGAVRLGRDVLVGEATVLDISTRIGDGAQLGHTSSLHTGQVVPAGERWHGSPAQPTEVDYRVLPTTGDNRARRIVFSALQLLNLLAIGLPLGTAVLVVIGRVPQVAALLDAGPLALTSSTFYAQVLVAATAGLRRVRRRRPPGRHHCPAPAPGVRPPGPDLPALRCRLLGAPGDHAAHQPAVLRLPVRRQLVHRGTTCRASATTWARSSRPAPTSASG